MNKINSPYFDVWVLIFFLGICSCSGHQPIRGVPQGHIHPIQQLVLRSLHFRRPSGPGAEPLAGPGGEDYTSHPLPDPKLDCQPRVKLHAGLDLEKIRQCLSSLSQGVGWRYRLRKQPEPYLELKPDKALPECVRKNLDHLPVPRELIFEAREAVSGSHYECYSARLSIESDDVPALGVKWPLARTEMDVKFHPDELPPQEPGEEKLGLLLDTWAMSFFLDPSKKTFAGHLIPRAICERCMGERKWVQVDGPPEALWPEELTN